MITDKVKIKYELERLTLEDLEALGSRYVLSLLR